MMQSQLCSKSCVACSQVKLYKTWLTCSTLVLAFSFSFSNTLKNLLEAIIYLFVVHPFDVGDGLFVGSTGTDYYKVHHLYSSQPCSLVCCSLLPTELQKVVYAVVFGASVVTCAL